MLPKLKNCAIDGTINSRTWSIVLRSCIFAMLTCCRRCESQCLSPKGDLTSAPAVDRLLLPEIPRTAKLQLVKVWESFRFIFNFHLHLKKEKSHPITPSSRNCRIVQSTPRKHRNHASHVHPRLERQAPVHPPESRLRRSHKVGSPGALFAR